MCKSANFCVVVACVAAMCCECVECGNMAAEWTRACGAVSSPHSVQQESAVGPYKPH